MPKKRKQSFVSGNVFLIPLENDGGFGVGVVVAVTKRALNSVVCAFYDLRVTDKCELVDTVLDDGLIISVQFTTPDLLQNGVWEIVEGKKIIDINDYFDLDEMEENAFVGVSVIGSRNITKFLSAFQGVYHWNCFYRDDYLDKLLLASRNKPERIYFIDK